MSDRTVKVSLVLNTAGYMQGMDAAAKKTREMGTEAEKLAQKKEAFNLLGTAALGFGAAVGAGVAIAVSKFAEFDQAMSYVQAATHETTSNMGLLRDAALDAGARTVFSATEAANAVEELAKAGVSTADILGGGLDASLDLAAAGGLNVADAAQIAATTLKQFGLQGKDTSHVADLLAAGAGKAQGDVSDMSQALKQGGLVANQFGLSVDETVGTLSAFASAGMLGSDAGTSFRTMLLRLANPSGEAADKMKELGINAYDASGKFVGMEGLAGQLKQSLSGLTEEQKNASLAIIFGQDAIRGANVLLEEGAQGIRKWTSEVNDQGYAAETAAMRLDNLKGDWEQFTGALDTAFISMGEGANGPLRGFVQELTGMVDQFNTLPDWAKQTALGVGGVTTAVGLAAGAFLLGVPKVAAFNEAIKTMGTGAQRTARLVGVLGKTAGAVGAFFILAKGAEMAAKGMGMMGEDAKSANATMSLLLNHDYNGVFKGLSTGTEGVNDLKSALDHLLATDPGSAFNRWGSDTFAWTGLESTVGKTREQFHQLGQSLADLVNRGEGAQAKVLFDEIAAKAQKYGYTVKQLNDEIMPEYQDALKGVKNESKLAGAASGVAADGLGDIEAAAADAQRELSDVVQALQDVAKGALDLGDTKDRAQSAINGMAEAAKAEGASLAGTNDASIRLRDTVREVEQAHRDSAQAIAENGGTLDDAMAAWQAGRDEVIKMRTAKGEDIATAQAWADKNLGSAQQVRDALAEVKSAVEAVPKKPVIDLSVTGTAAVYDELMRVQGALRTVTGNKGLHVATGGGGQGGLVANNATGNLYVKGKPKDFGAGGWASGYGIFPATSGGLIRTVEAGYDEAVITTDPKYRARQIDIMSDMAGRLGMWQQGGGASVAPQVNVAAPSLNGMSITGSVRLVGDGLLELVDARVVEAQQAASVPFKRGRR